jgi:hypothetical protein
MSHPRHKSINKRRAIGMLFMVALICLSLPLLKWTGATVEAQSIPPNPMSSCTVSSALFASWFQSGTPALNGVVNPADSVTFPNSPNCSFYQWSKQMFLWLTSPAPKAYGGGSFIFDSPTFYDVSPPDLSGVRTFVPHVSGVFAFSGIGAAKAGPNGLPILIDKNGTMIEVHPTPLNSQGNPLVLNSDGQQVEVGRIAVQNGKAIFLDPAGQPIPGAVPILPQSDPSRGGGLSKQILNIVPVQKFMMPSPSAVSSTPVFVTASSTVVQTEEGQADGGALLSQGNSLIYYATLVNDVYAYFLTGTKDGAIPPPGGVVANAVFPTTSAELMPIVTFASAHGVTFPDPTALAVEIKTSWVEASTLSNPGDYIKIMGTIPIYDTSSPTTWVQTGQKTVQLAMVGMHVVGSAAGHPEMIWATFEHFGNAPNAAYQYISTSGLQSVPQNTTGTWLFTVSGSGGPFNCMNQTANPVTSTFTNIVALSGGCATGAITPNNVIRMKAFGAAFNQTPNPLDASTAASNSEIISVNNATQVPGPDLRNQYFMTGATWTIGGAAPTGMFPGGNEVGTSRLINTTMETFGQGSSNLATGSDTNCFTCHVSNKVTVSHVFCDPINGCSAGLQPLF